MALPYSVEPTPTATATATATPTATVSGPQLVQQAVGAVTGATLTVTLPAPITAGNAVIVCVTYSAEDGVVSVATSPNFENDEFAAVQGSGQTIKTELWYFTNAASAGPETGVIVTQQAGVTEMVVNVSEWSGLSDTAEESVNNNSATGTTVTTNSVTPSSINNLVIAAGGWSGNRYSTGPTNGFTRMTPAAFAIAFQQESAYLVQTSATAGSTGWGLNASADWAAAIAVFGAP